jgi:hypothetical protein
MISRPYIRRMPLSKCPWRDKQPHGTRHPQTLTDAAIRHIELQIEQNHYRPLPYLGIVRRFYRCVDCYAVRMADSVFENSTEESVCGVYDHSLTWSPCGNQREEQKKQ